MGIKCKNCGSENIEIMTKMIASMPKEYYGKLTKRKMQSKDFKVWAVMWEDSDFICKDCGYVLNLKGNKNG